MYISKPFIEKLLQSVDILEVFQYIGAEKLQKKGAYYWCCSPFKSEKTPSCQIKVNTQRFIDYSSDISGNAITLLMQKNNLSFVEAVEVLAQMKGIPIEYENQERGRLLAGVKYTQHPKIEEKIERLYKEIKN
ncbi:CHC2 zinc finger domain-containing protein [Capnocytophaga sp. ARDL2]|uniref:CHC2 zinc finger domain-containing protein n=1 Tax=Capnocytophaga sp. ARDL2 TaxID=3238809 RepID=UPI003559207C